MDVFIHEDYVNKRNEVRRDQRRKMQMQMLQLGLGLGPAPAPAQGKASSPTATTSPSEEAVSSHHRRLFDCLKPY